VGLGKRQEGTLSSSERQRIQKGMRKRGREII
jgi:hypothetical protein